MSKQDLKQRFVDQNGVDVSEELVQEMSDPRAIQVANFGEEQLHPIDLLNSLQKTNYRICSQTAIALRTFCTLPVTVADAECSFSKLKLIKNYLRSTMKQDRHVAVLLDDSHDHNHRLYIAFCLHHAWHKIHKM